MKKNSQLEKFSKTRGKLPTEFRSGAKAGNFQNVLIPENQEEMPMESIPKSFDTDSRKSILKRIFLVFNLTLKLL